MRLYKRGQYWWCSFPWQGETVRRSTRCTTRTAALLTAQRWERERADPDHAAAASATFGGAVSAFLADLERTDKPVATRQFYRRKAGTLLRILGAARPLVEVNAQLVDKYIAAREAEPVAYDASGLPTRTVTANTIHKELVTLRQVLKRAKRRGEFRRDVSEVLPVGFSPRYVPRNVSLTFAEAERLLATLKPARAAAVAFALATTARRAEVFRAELDDVVGGEVELRGTKTAGSRRIVTVPPFAKPLLDFAVKWSDGDDDMLFRPWPNAIRGLRAACKRAKCPRVTWNDLRRTLSTWLVEGGVSDTVIAKMLGHVDTTMLHRVYGKPRQDAMGALLTEQSKAIPALTIGFPKPSGEGQGLSAPSPDDPCEGNAEGRLGRTMGTVSASLKSDSPADDVRLVHANVDEQEPSQPIATSEQDENPRENSGNAVGPVGIEPTTKGLKVQEAIEYSTRGLPLCRLPCVACDEERVRAVDVQERVHGHLRSCPLARFKPYCADPPDCTCERDDAVDVRQTSDRHGSSPGPTAAPSPLRGPGESGTTSGASVEWRPQAEGAGSPEEPPFPPDSLGDWVTSACRAALEAMRVT